MYEMYERTTKCIYQSQIKDDDGYIMTTIMCSYSDYNYWPEIETLKIVRWFTDGSFELLCMKQLVDESFNLKEVNDLISTFIHQHK